MWLHKPTTPSLCRGGPCDWLGNGLDDASTGVGGVEALADASYRPTIDLELPSRVINRI